MNKQKINLYSSEPEVTLTKFNVCAMGKAGLGMTVDARFYSLMTPCERKRIQHLEKELEGLDAKTLLSNCSTRIELPSCQHKSKETEQ